MAMLLSKVPTCVERTDLPRCPHHYRPRRTEILLIQLDIHQRITPISGTLHGIFVDALTRREICHYTKELNDTVLYAIASRRFPGYHYVVGYSHEIGAFACSCYEAKGGGCPHDIEIQEYVNEQAMLHV